MRHLDDGVGGGAAVEGAALDRDIDIAVVAGSALVRGGVVADAQHVGNRVLVAREGDAVERERGVAVDMQRGAQVIAAGLHGDFVDVVLGGAVACGVERQLDCLKGALGLYFRGADGDFRIVLRRFLLCRSGCDRQTEG